MILILARWLVEGNDAKEALFLLQKTVDAYKKHLESFAGDKLKYFETENLD